jgi:hypothetical protein
MDLMLISLFNCLILAKKTLMIGLYVLFSKY